MEGDKARIERVIEPGLVASLEPFDECCWRLKITKDGEKIESGIWCPVSKQLVIDGNIVGNASTKEDVLERLKPFQITYWDLC